MAPRKSWCGYEGNELEGGDKVRIIGRMIGGLRGWWRYIDEAMELRLFVDMFLQ